MRSEFECPICKRGASWQCMTDEEIKRAIKKEWAEVLWACHGGHRWVARLEVTHQPLAEADLRQLYLPFKEEGWSDEH